MNQNRGVIFRQRAKKKAFFFYVVLRFAKPIGRVIPSFRLRGRVWRSCRQIVDLLLQAKPCAVIENNGPMASAMADRAGSIKLRTALAVRVKNTDGFSGPLTIFIPEGISLRFGVSLPMQLSPLCKKLFLLRRGQPRKHLLLERLQGRRLCRGSRPLGLSASPSRIRSALTDRTSCLRSQ